MSTWEQQQRRIEAALSEASGGGLVVRWVAVADVLSADGRSRNLGLVSSPGVTSWECLGMLGSAADLVDGVES